MLSGSKKLLINQMTNIQAVPPKSTDNIISQRFNYKKGSIENENQHNTQQQEHVPQILSHQSNKLIRPRVLKTTTPYKSEKKEVIKKLSEKDMNFEDINTFKSIYKFDQEEDKLKIPILPTLNLNKNQPNPSQNNFNNTFNPLNQTHRTKLVVETNNQPQKKEEKVYKNPSQPKMHITNIVNNDNHPASFNISNRTLNNKGNLLGEYFQLENSGSGKQQEKKSNQNFNKTGKLEPIQFNEGTNKFLKQDLKIPSDKDPLNNQKIKFPKEIFCSNFPKKYIV